MRFKEAKGHKVMSTSTAEAVGKVDGFVVDPQEGRVVALHLKKTEGDGDTLPWEDLTAFGRDAVTVASPDRISVATGRIAELVGKDHELLGKRVLTESGDEVGQVQDVEFEVEQGRVTALLTKSEEIPGERLLGVGSYAVVVRSG